VWFSVLASLVGICWINPSEGVTEQINEWIFYAKTCKLMLSEFPAPIINLSNCVFLVNAGAIILDYSFRYSIVVLYVIWILNNSYKLVKLCFSVNASAIILYPSDSDLFQVKTRAGMHTLQSSPWFSQFILSVGCKHVSLADPQFPPEASTSWCSWRLRPDFSTICHSQCWFFNSAE
jgi:hypothetical protein